MHISPKDFFYPDYPDYKHIYPPKDVKKQLCQKNYQKNTLSIKRLRSMMTEC
jgi:hypothetical protein